jgi:OOP family OmpA-OmpF porin
MKKMILVSMFLWLAACFFPLNAAIAENVSFNRHVGPFAEASAGYTFGWAAGGAFGNDFADGTGIGFGWTVSGGYMFKDWIGIEAGYLKFSPDVEFEDEESDASVGGFFLAARFNIPVKERFSVVLKAGAMSLSASEKEDEEAITAGAPFTSIGAGYALTDKIDLRVQFQGPNLIFLGAGILSGGITYHF